MSDKVVIIGLDGVTFDVLQPWLAAGELPALAAMMRHGVSGRLRSAIPPVTPTAWSSFMTGKNPGKHGIYYFTVKDKGSGREIPVNASLRSGATIWDLLSRAGKTVAVINVPTTYPPWPVNGVMIADFLTPKGSRDFIYPQRLVEEIEARFGPYPLYLKTPMFSANLSARNLEAFLQELHEELEYKFRVAQYLSEQSDPDLTMLHIWGTDRIQHELWNLVDMTHPRYDAQLARRYQPKILDYFRRVDAQIANLARTFDADTTFLIVSDHGFGPVHKEIDLNVWLLQEGYIAIKRDLPSQLRYLAWKMGLTYELLLKLLLAVMAKWRLRLPDHGPAEGLKLIQRGLNLPLLSPDDIDWARTKAYAQHGIDTGAIHLNVRGREPRGSVEPGQEYTALRQEIVEKLKSLRDPTTGQVVGGEIYTKDEIYEGEHFDAAPDIVFLPMANGYLAEALLTFTTRRPIVDNYTFPGNHRMDGMLIARGTPLCQGRQLRTTHIVDMAPTILYLLGCPIPTDMDGEVLHEMFTPAFLAGQPIAYSAPPGVEPKTAYEMSASDEQQVISRLKDLGYL